MASMNAIEAAYRRGFHQGVYAGINSHDYLDEDQQDWLQKLEEWRNSLKDEIILPPEIETNN